MVKRSVFSRGMRQRLSTNNYCHISLKYFPLLVVKNLFDFCTFSMRVVFKFVSFTSVKLLLAFITVPVIFQTLSTCT